uniref:NADH-ubiquinone oxidoreductase chain 3 n=1 Tax=Coleoptera sp. 4 AH-2016 TaxID=1903826 RepID=A0A343C4K3_9COLE|nr:NADH dehydrogenase subunit 3 [Coleoptera sp. 4 AH-2016]
MYTLMIMIMLIMFIMTNILNFVSKKWIFDREKSSPFECGFDPKNSARLPFSLQFFLIAVIFVIFDVELTLLFPSITIFLSSNIYYFSMIFNTFLFILMFGLYHEKLQGSLDWKK